MVRPLSPTRLAVDGLQTPPRSRQMACGDFGARCSLRGSERGPEGVLGCFPGGRGACSRQEEGF
jgi:hypothetical protein